MTHDEVDAIQTLNQSIRAYESSRDYDRALELKKELRMLSARAVEAESRLALELKK